jgi:hypothetical protein
MPSVHLIMRTITAVFPHCRTFREHEAPSAEEAAKAEQDFANVVIFCIKRSIRFPSSAPLTFRDTTEADFLGSPQRMAHLVPKYEIPRDQWQRGAGRNDVLAATTVSRLDKWQKRNGVGHWKVMRAVVPAAVWESW